MKIKGDICCRCKNSIPTKMVSLYRGVTLGPFCLSVIKKRELLRSSGSNPRLVKDKDIGLTHAISDNSKFCPSDFKHCLQCSEVHKLECSLEKALKLIDVEEEGLFVEIS